jgi:hypothetical protein
MRKLLLIMGLVLASAAAQAEEPRNLTLSSDTSATTAPAKPAASAPAMAEAPQSSDAPPVAGTPKAVETPKFVDRPALVQPTTTQPPVQQSTSVASKPAAGKTASTHRTEKPRYKRYSTGDRIISELHRHGIYW